MFVIILIDGILLRHEGIRPEVLFPRTIAGVIGIEMPRNPYRHQQIIGIHHGIPFMLKKMEGAGFGRRLPQQHVVIIPIHRRFCTWGRRIPSVREHVHDEIAS